VTEQALDLWHILHGVRRRWRVAIGLLVVGLSTGVLLTWFQAPAYVARSLVLLPPVMDQKGNPVGRIETETLIVRSAEILDRAGKTFRPPVTSRALRDRISAQGLTPDVLEVRAEAGRPVDAKRLADAVVNEYVAYSNRSSTAEASANIALLQGQAHDLEQRVRDLESDILATTARLAGLDQSSAEGLRQAALLDSMRSAQAEASRQLAIANGRLADARLSDFGRRGTRVLQPAEVPKEASRPRPFWNIGASGLIGLVAGTVLALALDRNDGRLRRREAIAAAVGAPVVASLNVPRRVSAAKCRVLVGRWQPSPVEALALRQAFYRIGVADGPPPVNVVIVTLPGDRVAPLIALQLAAFAAVYQTSTAILIASAHATTAELRSLCSSRPARPYLSMHDATKSVDAVPLHAVDLSITIVVPGDGSLKLPTLGRRTLTALAVSSGFGTPEALAAAALACGDAVHPIRGVFVANPDPGDRTTGWTGVAARRDPVNVNGARNRGLSTDARAAGADVDQVIQ
jgi:capsular polysaccharide biosynthesis protein